MLKELIPFIDRLYPHQILTASWLKQEGYLDQATVSYWRAVAEFNPFITDMANYMLENNRVWAGLAQWREAIDNTAASHQARVESLALSLNDGKDHRYVTIKSKSGEPVTMIACDLVDLAKELIKHKNQMENL